MFRLFSWFLGLCVLCALARDTLAADWSHWRGPEQTGVSRETGLPSDFSTVLWRAPYGGRTTPIVQNGHVYVINVCGEKVEQQERVQCFDADTGKLLWEDKFNVFLTDIVSDRVGWTNLCGDPETGNVYAHGVQGFLFCFDKDGKILWQRQLTEEFGRISGYGGRTTSPIIDGDLLLMGMVQSSWGEYARGGNRFLAMDKKNGNVVWWSQTPGRVKDTYYSTPVVSVINGERILISGGADGGLHAFQVRTGKHRWSAFFGTAAVNCSPVVDGNFVYIGHGEENPDNTKLGRVCCFDASQITDGKPKLVWQVDGLKIKFASPIIHDGRLYVCDENARLFCLDAKTGKQIWKYSYGRNCMGSPILADGKVYVGEVNGKFHILKPGEKKCETLFTESFFSKNSNVDVELNGSPSAANGRVYFMTTEELICLGAKKENAAVTIPPGNAEATDDTKPAQLQVIPADVMLNPGESASFKARLYNAKGQFLKDAQPTWGVSAMIPPPPLPNAPPPAPGAPTPPTPPMLKGSIDAEGKLAVDKTQGQFGNVTAAAEGLTARARIRVAPVLPYTQDFNKVPNERTPAGWVNAMGKYQVQERNGEKVLVKLALPNLASPLVARAYAYIGPPSMSDYSIECDIQGLKAREDMPDMGVMAHRYTLLLDGNKQKLRLFSWDALPRIDKAIPYPWKPDVWYRFKLVVDTQGDKGVIRGKVWPKEGAEPNEWTVEVEDPIPNRQGSPALYGYATGILPTAKGAEILYDNLIVTPNKKAVSASK